MVHYIKFGDKERPVLFGMAALYDYERRTGKKALSEFSSIGAGEVAIATIVDLAYSGLIVGHRKERRDVDFDQYDVAEWLTPKAMEEVMQLFADSFPSETSEADAKKKKAG